MAMRVLIHGKQPTNKWIGQCMQCQCVIEAETRDLTNVNNGDRCSHHEGFSWETCPECKDKVCFRRIDSTISKRLIDKYKIIL